MNRRLMIIALLFFAAILPAQQRLYVSNLANRHAIDGHGIVVVYDMMSGAGQALIDRTGKGRDGQLGSGSGADAGDPSWIAGGGLDFPSGRYARLPAITELDFDGVPFTVLVHFSTDSSTSAPLVARGTHNSGSPFGGWALRHSDGTATFFSRTSAGASAYTYTNATTFTTGTKYVYGWSGTYRESAGTSAGIAYRGGSVLAGTETNTTLNVGDSSVFTPALGALQAGTGAYIATFDGKIYGVVIWNRALTAAEHSRVLKAMQ